MPNGGPDEKGDACKGGPPLSPGQVDTAVSRIDVSSLSTSVGNLCATALVQLGNSIVRRLHSDDVVDAGMANVDLNDDRQVGEALRVYAGTQEAIDTLVRQVDEPKGRAVEG